MDSGHTAVPANADGELGTLSVSSAGEESLIGLIKKVMSNDASMRDPKTIVFA